jgi:hypothetical protein
VREIVVLELEYRHVDVFSRRALRGNGLVVVLNAASLPAAAISRRLTSGAYRPQARPPDSQPTNYARTLLTLALTAAGMGEADEAAVAGTAALECGHLVWPTLVLAGKLAESRTAPGSAHAAGFRARYRDAGTHLALPAVPAAGSRQR